MKIEFINNILAYLANHYTTQRTRGETLSPNNKYTLKAFLNYKKLIFF